MASSKKQTASYKAYIEYIFYIIHELIENNYAPSYSNNDTMRKWYFTMPYNDDTMNFLIEKSILFIRTLNSQDSASTAPHFLDALTTKMADYLSGYAMRKDFRIDNDAAGQSARRAIRDVAKARMKDALYNNCGYIKHLFAQQQINRDRARSGNRRSPKSAARDYAIELQIQAEFRIMQRVPRRR